MLNLNLSEPSHTLIFVERSGSVGRGLDWGSKGCWFEAHWSRRVVFLSKKPYLVLSTFST